MLNQLTQPNPDLFNVPRIAQQTKWPAGIYDFGHAKTRGVDYFNCSIVEREGQDWLIVRRSKWKDEHDLGFNDLVAFSLKDNVPQMGFPIRMERRFDIEHFEDPRAVNVNGRIFISCCNFLRNKKGCTYPHQVVSEINSDWKSVKRYDPVFGNNGKDTALNKAHEKNWTWFWYAGEPHLVYWAVPQHRVTSFTQSFSPVYSYSTAWECSLWNFGQIRGGTPPVLVNGEYWTFFHSSTPWTRLRRQYHMGAYAFESKPPFRITKITKAPLLSGSKFDTWFDGKPICVFACGSIIRDYEWLVTFGVNDLECGWIKIPHKELERLTVKV